MFKFTKKFIVNNFFSVLYNYKINNCLDIFCGSGSLGLNFLKVNNSKTYFIDKDIYHLNNLKFIKKKLKNSNIVILKKNILNYLKYCKIYFDLVFIDPPFKNIKFLFYLLKIIIKVLNVKSFIYVETKLNYNIISFLFKNNFSLIRYCKINFINYYLFNFKK